MKSCLLDMGNTRWKWTMLEVEAAPVHSYEYAEDPVEGIITELGKQEMPGKLFIASVRHDDLNESLQKSLEARDCEARFLDWRDCVQIKATYEDPSRLGIDRYLNMIGALCRYQPPFITVSAGTAVAVDAVNEKAVHLGGALFPGKRLLENALIDNTDKVTIMQDTDHESIFGQNTEAGMQAGINAGYVAAVTGIINSMREALGEQTQVVLTGGDAAMLENSLRGGFQSMDSTLLFTGMREVIGKL